MNLMALSTLLAGLRATRMGAVAAAAALATTSVVAASAALPDQAAEQAQEAVEAQADDADDNDITEIDITEIDTVEIADEGEDNGRSEDVHAVLGDGQFAPEDGHEFGQAVADQARNQEDGSFGQAVAEAARGDDADGENGETEQQDVPPVDLPEQAERRGGNADDARS
jgi:hypothetical protein